MICVGDKSREVNGDTMLMILGPRVGIRCLSGLAIFARFNFMKAGRLKTPTKSGQRLRWERAGLGVKYTRWPASMVRL
jgi:hypothetical protein